MRNVFRRHGIAPAPKRGQITSWKDFIAAHISVLAGADFFTEVLTWRGLVTYYVLFFLHLETRRVNVAGITRHPDQAWMEQISRSATQEAWGYRHQLPAGYRVESKSVLGGLHHEYILEGGGLATGRVPCGRQANTGT